MWRTGESLQAIQGNVLCKLLHTTTLKMRVLLCLAVLSVILVLCEGDCWRLKHTLEIVNGFLLPPHECIDIYDRSKHPVGSSWDTAKCMKCECSISGMECCRRSDCEST